eukprot:evm.model.scf_3648.2 EVM.evm.TU.scf_3648.2   scf_3648:5784-8184(-)
MAHPSRSCASSSSDSYGIFAGFHTDAVDAMLQRAPSMGSGPLALPAWAPGAPARPEGGLGQAPLGAAARRFFMVDFEGWAFLNHGAFGAALACAFEEAGRWRAACERQPLKFLDRELFPYLVDVIQQLASYVKGSPKVMKAPCQCGKQSWAVLGTTAGPWTLLEFGFGGPVCCFETPGCGAGA